MHAPPAAELALSRLHAASLAAGTLAGCALLAVVDPNEGGPYPSCPTQVLLGLDCPACGTLRGTHALLRGRVAQALDHNLLLLVAAPVAALVWLGWVARAVGRPWSAPRLPGWAVPAAIAAALVFAVVRNIAPPGLGWLDSA